MFSGKHSTSCHHGVQTPQGLQIKRKTGTDTKKLATQIDNQLLPRNDDPKISVVQGKEKRGESFNYHTSLLVLVCSEFYVMKTKL